jgi:hypothetical protein
MGTSRKLDFGYTLEEQSHRHLWSILVEIKLEKWLDKVKRLINLPSK